MYNNIENQNVLNVLKENIHVNVFTRKKIMYKYTFLPYL